MNNEYCPDRWLIVKISHPDYTPIHKVFATWLGGYVGADRWRMNSGIVRVEQEDNFYLVYGYSGSVYRLRKTAWGSTGYGLGVLDALRLKSQSVGANIEIVPEDVDPLTLVVGDNNET